MGEWAGGTSESARCGGAVECARRGESSRECGVRRGGTRWGRRGGVCGGGESGWNGRGRGGGEPGEIRAQAGESRWHGAGGACGKSGWSRWDGVERWAGKKQAAGDGGRYKGGRNECEVDGRRWEMRVERGGEGTVGGTKVGGTSESRGGQGGVVQARE